MKLTRRDFLKGCAAAAASFSGVKITALASAAGLESDPRGDAFVLLFLRGGCDALNLIAPVDDARYHAARTDATRLTGSGRAAGLRLEGGLAGLDFRLHPEARALHELYRHGALAVVHACGLANGTRSHFEAMDLVDRGVAEDRQKSVDSGWLARHLRSAGASGVFPAIAPDSRLPDSLLGAERAFDVPDLDSLSFWGDDATLKALRELYGGESSLLGAAARGAFAALDGSASRLPRNAEGAIVPYRPDGDYGPVGDELGAALKTVARLIKLDLGVRVAAVDYGGWDTHEGQDWRFPRLVAGLSRALHGFYEDMTRGGRRVTVVVLSEFGRRLKASESSGTDHGHGGAMLVLGHGINGGRMYGRWPGLATEELDNQVDLAVTTDYRQVLAEVLTSRLGEKRLDLVFPGFTPGTPFGLARRA